MADAKDYWIWYAHALQVKIPVRLLSPIALQSFVGLSRTVNQ